MTVNEERMVNFSQNAHEKRLIFALNLASFFFAIIILTVSIVVNSLVLIIYARNAKLNPIIRPFLPSLCVTEIVRCVLVFWPFFIAIFDTGFKFPATGCTIHGALIEYCSLLSISLSVCIATARSWSIQLAVPLKNDRKIAMLLCSFVYALLPACLPTMNIFAQYNPIKDAKFSRWLCVSGPIRSSDEQQRTRQLENGPSAYCTLHFLLYYALPLVTTINCYYRVRLAVNERLEFAWKRQSVSKQLIESAHSYSDNDDARGTTTTRGGCGHQIGLTLGPTARQHSLSCGEMTSTIENEIVNLAAAEEEAGNAEWPLATFFKNSRTNDNEQMKQKTRIKRCPKEVACTGNELSDKARNKFSNNNSLVGGQERSQKSKPEQKDVDKISSRKATVIFDGTKFASLTTTSLSSDKQKHHTTQKPINKSKMSSCSLGAYGTKSVGKICTFTQDRSKNPSQKSMAKIKNKMSSSSLTGGKRGPRQRGKGSTTTSAALTIGGNTNTNNNNTTTNTISGDIDVSDLEQACIIVLIIPVFYMTT